jgi:hypothetical protein
VSEALYNAIKARYGFAIPNDYCRLESRGLFTLPVAAHASAFYQPGSYLWLHDMEWYSPQAILDFEFEPYHLPGFVPFAFTGGGDYWCWHPAHIDRRGAHVLRCYHDCPLAAVYAPNFHTALYRQILDFCVCSSEDEDIDASAFLHRWATELAVIFPDSWSARLRQLADDPQRSQRAPAIERADVSFDLMDTEIPWMQQTE